jgi:hypothetical protein
MIIIRDAEFCKSTNHYKTIDDTRRSMHEIKIKHVDNCQERSLRTELWGGFTCIFEVAPSYLNHYHR